MKTDAIATSWEKPFAEAAAKALRHDKREVLALVAEAKAQSKAAKATPDWNSLKYSIDKYLRTNGIDYWRELYIPLLAGVVTDQGKEVAVNMGMEFDVPNLEALDWFQDYTLTFAQPINDTTRDGVHAVIDQGMSEGWAIPTMQSHLTQLFTQWIDGGAAGADFDWFAQRLPPHRTELIARTETMRASNKGALNLGVNWGANYKTWLASLDGRERDSHRDAYAKYSESGSIGAIPVSNVFIVGGHPMMYPGDSSHGAPIGEIANCRCTVLMYPEKPGKVVEPEPVVEPAVVVTPDSVVKPSGELVAEDYEGPEDVRLHAEQSEALKRAGDEWFEGLNLDQKSALRSWTEFSYDRISGEIRTGDPTKFSQTTKDFIKAVYSAPLCTQVTYMGERGRRLARQLGFDDPDNLSFSERAELAGKIESFFNMMIGRTMVIPAAKSGSIAPEIAKKFAYGNGYVFQIKSKRGRWINPGSWRYGKPQDEYEVHYLDNTELKVVEVRQVKINDRPTLLIICEDVTPE